MELPPSSGTIFCEFVEFDNNIPLALLVLKAESNSGSATTVVTATRGVVVLASDDPFQVGLELEIDRVEERRLLVNVWLSFIAVSLALSGTQD